VTRRMRVILDSSARITGGVSRHLFELGAGLRDAGFDIKLRLPNAQEVLRGSAEERGLAFASAREVRRSDVVHIHLADTYDREALGRLLTDRQFSRTLVTEHLPHSNASDPGLPFGGSSSLRRDLKTLFKRAQLGATDTTITLSSSCRRFMARRYRLSSDRLLVIPNGIPEPAAAEPSGRRDLVVAVGALSSQKGFDTLIQAAAGQDRWSVEIYGDGAQRGSLQRQIMALAAPVRLMGWATSSDIPFGSSAVLAIPSRWEALPYVALEGMWNSLPIVASRVDGLVDLVSDGATGLLVEPDEPTQLQAAIDQLISSPKSARSMGDAARPRVRTHFSYEAMIESTIHAYWRPRHPRLGRRVTARRSPSPE
jgi:glycosyltransferase involved in cell wall biosynthesis